jgi:hypothetical protein
VHESSRHERASPGAADRNLVADFESDFAAQNIGDLVTVAMDVQRRIGTGWRDLLKHHDASGGLSAKHLEGS